MLKKILSLLVVLIVVAGLSGCFLSSGDSDDSDDSSGNQQVESLFLICAGRNPGGVGIDLDSGEAYNIDDKSDFDWDLLIQTKKGVKNVESVPTLKGAPYIKLKGTSVVAYNWSETANENTMGATVYGSIVLNDVTSKTYAADTVLEIDFTAVDKVVEGDGLNVSLLGKFYYQFTAKNGLKQEYAKLHVGEKWKTKQDSTANPMNTNHSDDPIYIIKSDDGSYFKLMITDLGPDSDIGESGYISVVWEKL